MVSIVPSRFAGLKIEDDDEDEEVRPKKSNKNQNKGKAGVQQTPANQSGKQKKTQQQKKTNQTKKKKANGVNEEQWEKWQERDKDLLDNNFEKDLQHALLLSKLEFEEQKVESEKCEKNEEKKGKGRGKKHQPMNLQQFNQMLEEKEQVQTKPVLEQPRDSNFFENITVQAKNILLKEKMQEIGQTQKNKLPTNSDPEKNVSAPDTDGDSTDHELQKLRQENIELREELDALKEKYKKVTSIRKNAELKEKVELVLEIQNLKKAQAEMSENMVQLYMELEQEKSRASQAGSDNKASRSTMRKSVRFDEQSFFENQ